MSEAGRMQAAVRNAMAGASIVLVGTFVAKGGGMLAEILIIRTFAQSEYGLLKLAIITTTLVGAVATLGLTTGLPRQLGVEIGKENDRRVREAIWGGILVSSVLSVAVAIGLFLGAPVLADAFDAPGFIGPMRVFALVVPAVVAVDVLVAAARGVGDSKPKVLFKQLIPKLSFLAGIGIVIVADLSFIAVVLAWAGGHVLTAIAFVPYGRRIEEFRPTMPSVGVTKALIVFSIPLLAVYMINQIHSWVDTFLVGLYLTPDEVGLYSGTVLLARILTVLFGAISFMYVPLASRFHGSGDADQINRFYLIMTKWIVGASLPLFLVFLLYPELVLVTLFGEDYRAGATVMQLLALGFFSHALLGLNGQSLIVFGRQTFVATALAIAVLANAIVSVALIPTFGIEGAALGSMAAYVTSNLLISAYLYATEKLYPFSLSLVMPVIVTVCVTIALWFSVGEFFSLTIYHLVVFSILVGIVHVGSYLITRSVDSTEVILIETVLETIGIPESRIMTLVRWAENVEK